MVLARGTGAMPTKALNINSYLIANNKRLEFSSFYVTDETDAMAYADLVNPAGAYNDVLEEQLTDPLDAKNISASQVYVGDVTDNGTYQTSTTTSTIPINLSIPATGIPVDSELKNVYVCATDKEIDCVIRISAISTFVVGNTVTGVTSGASGVIAKIYTVAGSPRLYLKSVAGASPFSISETIGNGAGATATITHVSSHIVLSVADNTGFTIGERVTNSTGSTATLYATPTGVLVLTDTDGEWAIGDVATGVTSSQTETVLGLSQSIPCNFVYFTGFFSYDTAGPTISTIQYIANGTDINFPVNLTRTSGVPNSVLFTDNRAVEIYQHNNLATAHNLRTNADTTYTYNTHFTNLTELQALISGLPINIEHTITFEGFDGAANMSVAGDILIGRDTVNGFSGSGTIVLSNFDDISEILSVQSACNIYYYRLTFDALVAHINAITAEKSNVYAETCYFSGTDYDICALADGVGACIHMEDCSVDLAAKPVVAAKATNNGVIVSEAWDSGTDNIVTGQVFQATNGGLIKKIGVAHPISSRTTYPIYEYSDEGGIIAGVFGFGNSYSAATFTYSGIDAADDYDVINQKIEMLGKYIPAGCTLNIVFPDTGGWNVLTDEILINGFYGGGNLTLSGAAGAAGYPSGHTTWYRGADGKATIKIKNSNVNIAVEKMTLACIGSQGCLNLENINNFYGYYNELIGYTASKDAYCLILLNNSSARFRTNYFSASDAAFNLSFGIYAIDNSKCLAFNNIVNPLPLLEAQKAARVVWGSDMFINGDKWITAAVSAGTTETTAAAVGGGMIKTIDSIIMNDKTATVA